MKSLKDEMQQIEQPSALHRRAIMGIERATKEKHRKKWLPTFLSIPVTAAVAYFIWLVSTAPSFEQNNQAAGLSQQLTNPYWLASICTALLVVMVWVFGRNHKKWRKQWGLVVVIAVSWIWNSAYYEAQQLPRPYVYPVTVNVIEGQGHKSIYIHAIINRSEFENTIRVVVINDTAFPINADYSLSLGNTAHHMTTNAVLDFQVDDLNKLMKQRSPIEAYAIFSDNQKVLFDIQFTELAEGKHTEFYGVEFDSDNNHKQLFKTEPTTITAISLPSIVDRYTLKSGNEIIKRVGVDGEEDIDLLPYMMEESMLEVSYYMKEEQERRGYQSPYYVIETTDGTINKMLAILFPPFSRDVVKEIRQEMMQDD
ncbi:hypothetical protein P9B03_15080 [Metasolibacillus meyeri]|uniref:DUF4179 domain-containing protein n=1 Tax=Metasolibacillus meyeri TaxID=1071052 RepID=A0AAW9NWT3_9BACL|nr:hypothetical protein [Metasolibacillus meyeri]MEC1179821.1 hypothetical protein [Metasolibacillus meyeri]